MSPLARIEIHCFRYRLARPLETVFGPVEARPALILRIEDADGAAGYGEVWCNFPAPGAEYRARLAAAVLPGVLSRPDGITPGTAFAAVRKQLNALALQAGEVGPADQIAAGFDIAVHDLFARRSGVPLATFLGGEAKPLLPYASGIGPQDIEALVTAGLAAGFMAFKFRVGFGRTRDLAAISEARETMGDRPQMMVDANQSWNLDEALDMVDAFGTEPIAWLEEPLAADRPPAEWARLAEATPIPLAGGENLRGRHEFDAVIEAGHVAVVQPDICKWGGLSECAPLARTIRRSGRRYCPHYLGGGVGLAASAHLLAAVGGDGLLEVDVNDNGLRELLAGPLLPLRDGRVHLPAAPGLGYEPDLDALSDLRTEHFDLRLAS